jgi:threonine synthase
MARSLGPGQEDTQREIRGDGGHSALAFEAARQWSPIMLNPLVTGIRCFSCDRAHDPRTLPGVCTACGLPLRVDYDLGAIRLRRADLAGREASLWRYREVLPLLAGEEVTLGEGFSPLLEVARNVWVKDESRNPTGSFKARGMAAAVSMAKRLGARALSAPSAGNAAGALAAYGARAGLPVIVAMPEDTPRAFFEECHLYGATVHAVKGTISDAGKFLREHGPKEAFDVSTLREPYRIEGKKTMAYELVEQMAGEVPDVVLYPTGGGTGLIGMWKAFLEMAALGWIAAGRMPRFVSVQAAGCAPVVKGLESGAERTEPWPDPETRAYGLRVPAPHGGFLCLRALRESRGTAVAIEEGAMQRATAGLAALSGIDVCPEGGAAWAALAKLRASGFLREDDRVVVFNTGTGLKYR